MKAKVRQHKQPVVPELTPQQRANAKEWHAQKLAESFGQFDNAMIRCWKILGGVNMICESMRVHAQQLQHYAKKNGGRKCKN